MLQTTCSHLATWLFHSRGQDQGEHAGRVVRRPDRLGSICGRGRDRSSALNGDQSLQGRQPSGARAGQGAGCGCENQPIEAIPLAQADGL